MAIEDLSNSSVHIGIDHERTDRSPCEFLTDVPSSTDQKIRALAAFPEARRGVLLRRLQGRAIAARILVESDAAPATQGVEDTVHLTVVRELAPQPMPATNETPIPVQVQPTYGDQAANF